MSFKKLCARSNPVQPPSGLKPSINHDLMISLISNLHFKPLFVPLETNSGSVC